jgi:hypothetical protein
MNDFSLFSEHVGRIHGSGFSSFQAIFIYEWNIYHFAMSKAGKTVEKNIFGDMVIRKCFPRLHW